MFALIPWGVIEQTLRLINNLLEARPPAQRQAEATIWFWKLWPIVKIGMKPEQILEIEKLMKGEDHARS